MRFLICGLGSIGRRHLRHLAALGETDIILYRTRHSTLPDEDLAFYPTETDLQAALAHRPDAVIIANPTALHLAVALPAARAGCHILLEKPISDTLTGVDDLRRAAYEFGNRILVGFQFRYHPALHWIKAALDSALIGRPLSARAHWGEYLPDWHPWEDYRQGYAARKDLGGGVVLTLTHPLDYLRWLFGEVRGLSAWTGKLSDLEMDVEDTAEILLEFAAGPLASLHLNYTQRPPRHGLEIIGTAGTIRWNNADHFVEYFTAETPQWQRVPIPPDFERDHLFRAQMAHFIEVVRGDAQPACTLMDGEWALKLALAAQQSAEIRQRVEFAAG